MTSQATKQQFVMAALTLFAEHGTAAVSMRHVNRSIGTRNNSAAHYHFGDKEGLIDAVFIYIQDWFAKARSEPLSGLEHKARIETVDVYEILAVWIDPYLRLIREETWGFDAIRLLARIQHEQDSFSRDAHSRRARIVLDRFKELILRVLQHLPEHIVLHRLSHFAHSFVQSLAISGIAIRSAKNRNDGDLEAIAQVILDFSTAGMKAENTFEEHSKLYARLKTLPQLF